MLTRPALAVFDKGYHFIEKHSESFGWFDAALLDELWIAKGLILMAEVDLGAPWAPVARCSDAG
eukprot:8739779-Pyramimonas_sp.AAC.1